MRDKEQSRGVAVPRDPGPGREEETPAEDQRPGPGTLERQTGVQVLSILHQVPRPRPASTHWVQRRRIRSAIGHGSWGLPPDLPASGLPGLPLHPLHHLLGPALAWRLGLGWQPTYVQLAPCAYGVGHGGALWGRVAGLPPASSVAGAPAALEGPPCGPASGGLHLLRGGAGRRLPVSQPCQDPTPLLPAQLAGAHHCCPLCLPVAPGLRCLPAALGFAAAAQPPQATPRLLWGRHPGSVHGVHRLWHK